MYTIPQVGDTVATVNGKWTGKVIQVNEKWGWFKVDYVDIIKIYDYPCSSVSRIPSKIELADARLRAESSGQTDSWRNYD